jgi:Mrp family chromosome partitioning ATPase/capsular polysaccharide biosynthesis protein
MELVHYLRIVRRRWRVVAAFCVVGALVGVATSLMTTGPKVPGTTYYLAKHTLSSSDGTANLTRDAVFCTEGEVPKRVAAKIGFDNASALAAKVTCEPHPETNLLYIAAADTDPKRTVLIADSFAEQLVVYLREVGEQQKATKVDTIKKQITGLETSYQQVKTELATAPADRKDLLQARLNDLANKTNTLRDQQNVAESQPAVTETLTTLSTAEAITISQSAFDTLNSSDPAKKTGAQATGINSATRQSQIDAAIKSGNTLGKTTRGGLGAALGLLLGVALVIVLDRIDPRIRTKFEAEEAFGWPVIGEIPPLTRRERQSMSLLAFDEPRSRAAEAYRVLRSALLFATTAGEVDDGTHPIFANIADAAPASPGIDAATSATAGSSTSDSAPGSTATATRGQVIMVTSPGPSEGKTTTAANMAAILGETGRSVIVINCDFRRPRVHLYLGAPDSGRQVNDTKVPNVKLVTQVLDNPQDANPAEVVAVQRQVIRNAREMFDIVLLDTAPLLTTNDATEVLAVADQVVVVAKAGKTHKEAADRAAELLERRGGPVIGVVLVGATDVPTSRYYYYGDTPDREEPEPGAEESSPLDALLATTGGGAGAAPSSAATSSSPSTANTGATTASATTAPPPGTPAEQERVGDPISVSASSQTSASASTSTSASTAVADAPPSNLAGAAGTAGATAVGGRVSAEAPTSSASTAVGPDPASTTGRARRGRKGATAPSASASAATTAPAPVTPPSPAAGTGRTTTDADAPSSGGASTGTRGTTKGNGKTNGRNGAGSPRERRDATPQTATTGDRDDAGASTTPTPASPAPGSAAHDSTTIGTPAAEPPTVDASATGTTADAASATPSPSNPEPPSRGRRGRLRGKGAATKPTPPDDFPAELIALDAISEPVTPSPGPSPAAAPDAPAAPSGSSSTGTGEASTPPKPTAPRPPTANPDPPAGT